MRMRHPLAVMLALPVVALAGAALASPFADGTSGVELKALIAQTLQDQGLSGEALISAARGYPACAQAPTVTPYRDDWSNLLVTCDGPNSWKRQVRSTLTRTRPARREQAQADPPSGPLVATLKHPLRSGAVITPEDIEMAPAANGTADGSFSDPNSLIGQRLARNLGEGRAVQARHLEKNWLVTRDMRVAIQFETGGMTISAPGISLENGELGEQIEIRNLSSGTVLFGQVAGPQKIVVRAKTY